MHWPRFLDHPVVYDSCVIQPVHNERYSLHCFPRSEELVSLTTDQSGLPTYVHISFVPIHSVSNKMFLLYKLL